MRKLALLLMVLSLAFLAFSVGCQAEREKPIFRSGPPSAAGTEPAAEPAAEKPAES